jgi:hypothetical protein
LKILGYDVAENSGETVAGSAHNLRPWPKGVSGNPGGRPRKRLITDELVRLLQQEAPNTAGKTWAAAIAEVLLKQALNGDVRAIGEVANRVEGKPLQAMDLHLDPPADIQNLTEEELNQRIAELERELFPTMNGQ